MDQVLLDTDVFSLFLRRDTRSSLYDADVLGKVRCLSVASVAASVAELRFGAVLAGWEERRRRQLEDAIAHMIVLPADNEITDHWAQIKATRQRCGRPISSEDCWIAATALRHDLPLLTHNAPDYASIPGLIIISHASDP